MTVVEVEVEGKDEMRGRELTLRILCIFESLRPDNYRDHTHSHTKFKRQKISLKTAFVTFCFLTVMTFTHLFRFEQLDKITRRINK